MRIIDILRNELVGKKLIDTEFSSKGDYAYYEAIGKPYPGFDGVITGIDVYVNIDNECAIKIYTTTGKVICYFDEKIKVEDL